MHQSVLDAFVRFSTPLEGETHNPYLDIKGLLTVGIGCLIEGSMGYNLPWVFSDGFATPAPRSDVIAQLQSLKAQQGLAHYAFNSKAVLCATTIRLTDAGILQLCQARLALIEPFMLKAFPAFATWPADAQLFACSIGWAEGAGWAQENPNLTRVLRLSPPGFLDAIMHAPDPTHPGIYLASAASISTKNNPGIVPRNAQNELALSNAALVVQRGLPVEKLYWPDSVVAVEGVQ